MIKHAKKLPNNSPDSCIIEAKKYYRNIDERIIEAIQISLNDMKLSKNNIDKIAMLIIIACNKHYERGFCNAKK